MDGSNALKSLEIINQTLETIDYGTLFFGDNGTGPANESKRTKRAQGWLLQIIGVGFYYLQYYYFVK